MLLSICMKASAKYARSQVIRYAKLNDFRVSVREDMWDRCSSKKPTKYWILLTTPFTTRHAQKNDRFSMLKCAELPRAVMVSEDDDDLTCCWCKCFMAMLANKTDLRARVENEKFEDIVHPAISLAANVFKCSNDMKLFDEIVSPCI